jgi:hypothetical protein
LKKKNNFTDMMVLLCLCRFMEMGHKPGHSNMSQIWSTG